MKKKGFTLIELLVVIAIIAMLMAILMPALGRVRRLAQRLVCGTNLKGLGTATMVYSNENDEEYPIAGGKGNDTWATKNAQSDYWDKPAFDWSGDQKLTISASLYLLVREADVSPKQFVCGSSDQKPFEGSEADDYNGETPDITELWDFGGTDTDETPIGCVSYSYHMPYDPDGSGGNSAFPLSATDSAGMVIMADKNPFYDAKVEATNAVVSTGDEESWMSLARAIADDWSTTTSVPKYQTLIGNSNAHLREGQNVLYNDGHVAFEKRADVGVQNDNIYTTFTGNTSDQWDDTGRRRGNPQFTVGSGRPKSDEDSFLVDDDDSQS